MSLGEVQFGDFLNLFQESSCIRHTSKDWTSKWDGSPLFLVGLLRGIVVVFFQQYSLIRQLGWLWHVATKVNRIDSAITEAWQKNRDAKLRGQVSDEWMSGWMDEVFMAFFPWWTTEPPSCLNIDDEGVDYRHFGDAEIHTPKTILEYIECHKIHEFPHHYIDEFPLNLNSQITFLGAGPNSIILTFTVICGLPGGLWTSPTWHQRSVRAGLSVRWRQQKSWKPGTVAFAIPTLHTQGPKRRKVFMKLTRSFPEAFCSWVLWKMFKGKDPFEWTC